MRNFKANFLPQIKAHFDAKKMPFIAANFYAQWASPCYRISGYFVSKTMSLMTGRCTLVA